MKLTPENILKLSKEKQYLLYGSAIIRSGNSLILLISVKYSTSAIFGSSFYSQVVESGTIVPIFYKGTYKFENGNLKVGTGKLSNDNYLVYHDITSLINELKLDNKEFVESDKVKLDDNTKYKLDEFSEELFVKLNK